MSVSSEIYGNVARRGYTHRRTGSPFAPQEFVARQAVKAAEEALEALELVKFLDPDDAQAVRSFMHRGIFILRRIFDHQRPVTCEIDAVLAELADVLVPGHAAFGSVGQDGDHAALAKSYGDVKRGVRQAE